MNKRAWNNKRADNNNVNKTSPKNENSQGGLPVPPYPDREISPAGRAFDYFYEIVSLLMSPDGCPWDREQTPSSMRKHILEEAYELIEAIENNDPAHMDEEMGDLFLVVSMVLRMRELSEENRSVAAPEVFELVAEKLVRRHPHVFADSTADNPTAVKAQWDTIKESVEGKLPAESLNEEHKGFPPLARAQKLQKKAAKQGFDWPDAEPVIKKVREELGELEELLPPTQDETQTPPPQSRIQEEVGDLLFSVVNLARKLKVDPSLALAESTRKFAGRFDLVKQTAEARGLVMPETPLEELDEIWREVKKSV